MSKQFYITTAIDYVNGQPHLGHAYEKVITDVIARARRCLGKEVFYLTGLDEHGQKVQQAAEATGQDAQTYCDGLAQDWQSFVEKLGISNNDFVRTTDARHKAVVAEVLQQLYDKGEFYQDEYVGFYSAKQETFLTEKDRNEDGEFDPIYGEVQELREKNYYFKLGQHQQWLIDYIEANPDFVAPDYRRNEVLGFLKNETLEDLCISRPKERLEWGIPLPFDPDYVTYVWFDALTNYLSIPRSRGEEAELWPADIHVIGKDILKFHAVYWPIMLKAAGLELPKQVLVHGWWQKDNQKMSKSTGNVVDPVTVIDDWGLDAFRYYVVRELAIGPDGNWTDEGFATRYGAELANGLGNLMNRSLSMLNRYREGVVPEPNDELSAEAIAARDKLVKELKSSDLQEGLRTIWTYIARVNQYVDQTAPFKLAKDPEQAERLGEVLYNLVESCRLLAVWLQPYLPDTSRRIYEQLGLPTDTVNIAESGWGELAAGHKVNKPEPLFPRRDQ
ncbi:MAG: methionine--tRNA ligase [Pedosphaera sp.]|nr:methionine--tRNA ligase [Pedosphaera sp.]